MLKSIKFSATPEEIQHKLSRGYKCVFDIDTPCIRFKRPASIEPETIDVNHPKEHLLTDITPSELPESKDKTSDDVDIDPAIFSQAYQVINESGRGNYFLSVLQSLASGKLDPKNLPYNSSASTYDK
jgi:hypothetical protein